METIKEVKGFKKINRLTGPCWVYLDSKRPYWAVYFDIMPNVTPYYEVFTNRPHIKPDPKREPWSHDNVRLSDGRGYSTLEEAEKAIKNHIGD